MSAASPDVVTGALSAGRSSRLFASLCRLIGYGGRRCYACRTSLVTHHIPATGKNVCAKCANGGSIRTCPGDHGTGPPGLIVSGGGGAKSPALGEAQLNQQLSAALTSRVTIEQAKGVISERAGIGMSEAFTRLRSYARNRNLGLTDVAEAAVDGTLDPLAWAPGQPNRPNPDQLGPACPRLAEE